MFCNEEFTNGLTSAVLEGLDRSKHLEKATDHFFVEGANYVLKDFVERAKASAADGKSLLDTQASEFSWLETFLYLTRMVPEEHRRSCIEQLTQHSYAPIESGGRRALLHMTYPTSSNAQSKVTLTSLNVPMYPLAGSIAYSRTPDGEAHINVASLLSGVFAEEEEGDDE